MIFKPCKQRIAVSEDDLEAPQSPGSAVGGLGVLMRCQAEPSLCLGVGILGKWAVSKPKGPTCTQPWTLASEIFILDWEPETVSLHRVGVGLLPKQRVNLRYRKWRFG